MKIDIGILTGGKSSRMGKNKALLKYEGISLLEGAIKQGQIFLDNEDLCSGRLIVSVDNRDKYAELLKAFKEDKRLYIAVDERKEYGPLEGIYQILKAAGGDYVFIRAVDMPLLSAGFIKEMSKRLKEDVDCLIIQKEGRLEPLCGFYSKKALSVIEKLFEEEEHRLKKIFEDKNIRTHVIDVCELEEGARATLNINTPEDFEKLKNSLDG